MTIDRDALVEKAAKAINNVRWNSALPHANPNGGIWTDTDLARAALDAILPEVQAQTLEDAADSYSDWETFVAADGIASTRMHGKDPDDWMRDRAAEYRQAASE